MYDISIQVGPETTEQILQVDLDREAIKVSDKEIETTINVYDWVDLEQRAEKHDQIWEHYEQLKSAVESKHSSPSRTPSSPNKIKVVLESNFRRSTTHHSKLSEAELDQHSIDKVDTPN